MLFCVHKTDTEITGVAIHIVIRHQIGCLRIFLQVKFILIAVIIKDHILIGPSINRTTGIGPCIIEYIWQTRIHCCQASWTRCWPARAIEVGKATGQISQITCV